MKMQERPTGRPSFMKSYHDKVMAWLKKMKQAKADSVDEEDETMRHGPLRKGPHHMGPHGRRPTGRPDQMVDGMRPTGRPHGMRPHHMRPHHQGPNFLKDLHNKATKMEEDQDEDLVDEDETARYGNRWSWKNRQQKWWQRPTGRPMKMQERPTGRPSFLKSYHDKVMAWFKKMKQAKADAADDEDETEIIGMKDNLLSFQADLRKMLKNRPTGRPGVGKEFSLAVGQRLKEAKQQAKLLRPTGRPTEDQKKEYDQWISKMKFAYENIKKKMQTREKAFREKQLAKQKAKAQAKAEN